MNIASSVFVVDVMCGVGMEEQYNSSSRRGKYLGHICTYSSRQDLRRRRRCCCSKLDLYWNSLQSVVWVGAGQFTSVPLSLSHTLPTIHNYTTPQLAGVLHSRTRPPIYRKVRLRSGLQQYTIIPNINSVFVLKGGNISARGGDHAKVAGLVSWIRAKFL